MKVAAFRSVLRSVFSVLCPQTLKDNFSHFPSQHFPNLHHGKSESVNKTISIIRYFIVNLTIAQNNSGISYDIQCHKCVFHNDMQHVNGVEIQTYIPTISSSA